MTDKSLMEMVEDFGLFKWSEGSHDTTHSHRQACDDRQDADALLSEIRQRVAELERDAARFQHLQNLPPKEAQAYFWTYSSRTERKKAIDAAMLAARQEGE